jgi:hypothetical protein
MEHPRLAKYRERYANDAEHRQRKLDYEKKRREDPVIRAKVNAYAKEYHLKKMYGLTDSEVITMLEEQDSKCGICERELDRQAVCVDHCHTTGKVRGILCRNCNMKLGWYEKHFEAAATYLETP